jgi:hypothetical protein
MMTRASRVVFASRPTLRATDCAQARSTSFGQRVGVDNLAVGDEAIASAGTGAI